MGKKKKEHRHPCASMDWSEYQGLPAGLLGPQEGARIRARLCGTLLIPALIPTSPLAPAEACRSSGPGAPVCGPTERAAQTTGAVFPAGEAEVHPSAVPCDDGCQQGGPDPCQGDLRGHCAPAPQQCCQLRPADRDAQGQLEAPGPGFCPFRLCRLSEYCSQIPVPQSNSSSLHSLGKICSLGLVSVTLGPLLWWKVLWTSKS